MRLLTNCVLCDKSDVSEIRRMIDKATDISHDEFRAALDDDAYYQFEENLGYDRFLRLEQDYHVSFHRSVFRGEKVVFCNHSAIEYIFSSSA